MIEKELRLFYIAWNTTQLIFIGGEILKINEVERRENRSWNLCELTWYFITIPVWHTHFFYVKSKMLSLLSVLTFSSFWLRWCFVFYIQQNCPPVVAYHIGSLGFLTCFKFPNYKQDLTSVLKGKTRKLNSTFLRLQSTTICNFYFFCIRFMI
jgi:hypothetical protein